MDRAQGSHLQSQPISRSFLWAWVIALIMVAIYLRIDGVGGYYYSEDEAMHVRLAQADSLKDLTHYSLYEEHPPLGHMLRYFWMKLSDDIAFVRALSLVFGIATILLYYRIGKLLKSELGGMCCAAFATFGYGLIIQSYVARNYSIFMFFISAAMYGYLAWQKDKRSCNLALYSLNAALAVLTHFSAIFAIFPIASYQAARMFLEKEKLSRQALWVLMNMAIAAVAIMVYYVWVVSGTTRIANGAIASEKSFPVLSNTETIFDIFVNPLYAAGYLLPSLELIPFLVFLLFLPSVTRDRKLRDFLWLAAAAWVFSMGVIATHCYYPTIGRHGVWIMPFILPAAGCLIASGLQELAGVLNNKRSAPWLQIALVILLVAGVAMYDPAKRFSEASEYQMTQAQWRQSSDYMENLNRDTLIVAARDDAVLFINTYPWLGNDAFTGAVRATLASYHHTHILFNPYNRRFFSGKALLDTIQEAQKRHMLDGIDSIVFVKPAWPVFYELTSPIAHLVACPVKKEIISFPALPALASPSAEQMAGLVVFIKISKEDFLDQDFVHQCFGGTHEN